MHLPHLPHVPHASLVLFSAWSPGSAFAIERARHRCRVYGCHFSIALRHGGDVSLEAPKRILIQLRLSAHRRVGGDGLSYGRVDRFLGWVDEERDVALPHSIKRQPPALRE